MIRTMSTIRLCGITRFKTDSRFKTAFFFIFLETNKHQNLMRLRQPHDHGHGMAWHIPKLGGYLTSSLSNFLASHVQIKWTNVNGINYAWKYVWHMIMRTLAPCLVEIYTEGSCQEWLFSMCQLHPQRTYTPMWPTCISMQWNLLYSTTVWKWLGITSKVAWKVFDLQWS